MLGNRIGLPHGGYIATLAQLVKLAGGVLYLDARKADGTQKGVNAPFTNPLIDLTKLGNNATLTNFAATQTDGYTLEATVNSNGQAVEYSNLVVNPSFEDDSNGWSTAGGGTNSVVTEQFKFGTKSMKFVNDGTSARRIKQVVSGSIGDKVHISGWAYISAYTSGPVQLQARTLADGALNSYGFDTTKLNQWQYISTLFTLTENGFTLVVGSNSVNQSTVYFDGIQVVKLNTTQITAFETQLGKPLDAPACDRIFPFVATTGITLVSARPYLATDGIDSFGLLANNPSVDIVGTEDFAIAWCGLTPTTLQTSVMLAKNLDTSAAQFSWYIGSDTILYCNIGGTLVQLSSAGAVKTNTNYEMRLHRASGRLKCWINGVLIYDQPNTTSLVSMPNFRLFCRSSNAGGTAHVAFAKLLTAYLILARGTYGDLDKLDGVLDKVARDYR